MAKVIKNLTVGWTWDGDNFALKGFNIAITEGSNTPTTETIILANVPADSTSYVFKNITLDTGKTYTSWVQATYEGADSEWLSNTSGTVVDDGLSTITIKSEVVTIAEGKANTALASAQTYAEGQASSALASAQAYVTTVVGNTRTNGLGIKVNQSTFSGADNGEIYVHGYNAEGVATDTDGWIMWNGVKVTVTKGMINPNAVLPFNTPIYYVWSTSSNALYLLFYSTTEKKWKYSSRAPSALTGDWTWADGHAVLGQFVMSDAETIVGASLYQTPKHSSEVVMSSEVSTKTGEAITTANTASTNASSAVATAGTASTNASNAVTTANSANTTATTASTTASTALTNANTANTNASNAVTTANSASTNASNAVATANSANTAVTDMASDSKLSPLEKQGTLKEWNTIQGEYQGIVDEGTRFAVTTSTFTTAYNALNTYVTPLVANLTTTDTIVGATFRTNFKAYYDARQVLLNAISAKAKTIADGAVSTASTASTSASSAVTTANSAVTTANSASTNASNAVTTANSASTSASNALSTANTAQSTATTASTNASSAVTTANSASTSASNAVSTANTASELARAMAQGKDLYSDPIFKNGNNSINVYNNSGNGNVVVTRIAKPADAPTTSTHVIEVKTTGTASPNWGGFFWGNISRASAIFIYRIIAKIPSGRTINFASNETGAGGSGKWLTSNAGTDKYEEYVYKLQCGNTGTFSSTGFFHIGGGTADVANPLIWYLAYANAFDITDNDYTLADMTSDSKLSPVEKMQLKKEWDVIVAEKPSVVSIATTYGVTTEKTNFESSYDSLNTYLTPLLSNLSITSDIVGSTFRANFDDYYDKKAILQGKISEIARTLANNAQGTATTASTNASTAITTANGAVTTANTASSTATTASTNASNAVTTANSANTTAGTASTNASNAVTTANSASTNATNAVNTANTANTNATNAVNTANSANSAVTEMSSDSKLSPVEKQIASREWSVISGEYAGVLAEGTRFAVTTSTYTTTYNDLNTYITPLIANLTTTSDIVGTTFRDKFKVYYDARQVMLNAISAKAKTIADGAVATAGTASTNASNAVTTANGAVTTANSASTNASSAVTTANSASSSASTALSTANTASTTATTASTNASSAVATANTAKSTADNLTFGGTNIIRKSAISTNNLASSSYDLATNTWTMTAVNGAGGTWGAGLQFTGKTIVIPRGSWYVLSFEIFSPVALDWNIDVNNFAVTNASWSGNDNDNGSLRATSSKAIPANTWTKCWSLIKNTHVSATDDIYDNSNFGLVNTSGANVTFKMRNVQGELGNRATDYSACQFDTDLAISSAETASKAYADAQLALEATRADAYADGVVTAEESARIAEATAKLTEAKNYASAQASTAQSTAISTASSDATSKANTALSTAQTYTTTVVGNTRTNGLGIKVDYSSFTSVNAGEIYVHGYNTEGVATDSNGWAMWNGAKVTITKGMINPNAVLPFNTPIYYVWQTNDSKMYLTFYDTASKKWKYSFTEPTVVSGDWTWNGANHIVLGQFTATSSETIAGAVLYQTPKHYTEIVMSSEASTFATTQATTAETTAKAYADAQLALEVTRADAYADGVVSDEESARISDATAKLATAKTYAEGQASSALSTAQAYANTAVHVQTVNGTTKIFSNLGGLSVDSGTQTGYIIIQTPITWAYMNRIRITGYNYVKDNSNIDLTVSFYAYTDKTFHQYDYVSSGSFPIKDVKLARNGNNVVIIIGTPTTVYEYPKIAISEAVIGYNNPPDTFKDGWSVSIANTYPVGYTNVTVVSGVDTMSSISDIETDIGELNTATTALQNFTNTSFADGIIQRAEAQAIAEHLNTLTKENTDVVNQYTTVYANVNLTGTPKTNLASAKTAYDTAYTNLRNSINTAISDNATTTAEKTDVDAKFVAYGTAIKTLTQRLSEGLVAISNTLASSAQTTAISTASTDATNKANTAQSTAISTASSDATSKANTAQSTAIASARLETYKKTNLPVRYIRDSENGNTANTGNHWFEIQAISNSVNVALNKTVTASSGGASLTALVDGVTSGTYASTTGAIAGYVQVDLGSIYYDIDEVKVWRYWTDGRTYHQTKTEVSSDGVKWYPIFDSLIEGEYAETSAGKSYAPTIAKAEALLSAKLAREQALAYADGVVDAEETARISAISSSLSTAQSYASTQASTAQSTAIATASADATSKANTAQSTAISTASSDATSKANTAQTNAISTASADATSKANTAQTNATAVADTNLKLSVEAGILNKNPIFKEWGASHINYPSYMTYWNSASFGVKETVIVKNGGNGLRFKNTGTTQCGATLSAYFKPSLSPVKYVMLEVDFYLVSGVPTGAGVLLDWGGMTTYRTEYKLTDMVTEAIGTGKWYTAKHMFKRPSDTLTGFTGMAGYLMANYASLGTATEKDIIYDRFVAREATLEEINLYEGKAGWDTTSTSVTNNSATWGRASNINSDGTFNTTKLSGTVTDAQVASGSTWNTAKNNVNDMLSDAKVTPLEKQSLKIEYDAIVKEKAQADTLATTYSLTGHATYTTYVANYNTLTTYINTILASMTTTSSITRTTMETNMSNYYDYASRLSALFNSTAKTIADGAVSTAGTASTNATNAVNTANTANSTAGTANTNATNAVNTANTANSTAGTASTNASSAVTTANSAVTTANSASTNATNAVNTANTAKSTVDNLDVGGTNLVLLSATPKTSSVYKVAEYTLSEDWVVGRTYTITIKGTLNGSQVFGVWRDTGATGLGNLTYNATRGVWVLTVVAPTTAQAGKNIISVYNVASATATSASIEWIQVEKGNKSTDWTPSPEDPAMLINGNTMVDGSFRVTGNMMVGGTLSGSNVTITNLNASNITAGTLSADKISGGTINGSIVNVTNLNASNITSGTISADKISAGILNGLNMSLNLATGKQVFTNPTTGDSLSLTQGKILFAEGTTWERNLAYTSEGLHIFPGASNTGTNRHTSIKMQGALGFIDFINLGATSSTRIVSDGASGVNVLTKNDGTLQVRDFGDGIGNGAYRGVKAGDVFTWDKNINEGAWEIVPSSLGAGVWHYADKNGGDWNRVRYSKTFDNLVTITGLLYMEAGYRDSADILMNLPYGYRPDGSLIFSCMSSAGNVRVDVYTNGNIQLNTGAQPEWVSLSGISYYVN